MSTRRKSVVDQALEAAQPGVPFAHLRIDTDVGQLGCQHCGAHEAIPEADTLHDLRRRAADWVLRHRGCRPPRVIH